MNTFRYMSLILAVLWTAFIVYGLLSEPSGTPRFPWLVKPGVDKVIHAILFGVEAGLLGLAFQNTLNKLLVVSVVGTVQDGWSMDDLADDYARCARWAVESGADAVETNFSCPSRASIQKSIS